MVGILLLDDGLIGEYNELVGAKLEQVFRLSDCGWFLLSWSWKWLNLKVFYLESADYHNDDWARLLNNIL